MDGEGTISFASKYSPTSRQARYHFRPEFKLTNSCDKMMREVISIFDELGCAYHIKEVKQPNKTKKNWKPYTKITVDGMKRLQKLLPIFIPYLISKREQAELVLQYIESRFAGGHKDPVTDEQARIVLKVRQLNHRGVLNRPETIRRTPITVGEDIVRSHVRA